MNSSMINTALEILAFLAILSGILSIVAAAMLSSRITRQQEEQHMPQRTAQLTPAYQIWHAILAERAYQDRKYGTIQDRNLTLDDYIVILSDELCEAGISFRTGDLDNARCELLQVAAVAIAALEAHGLVERHNLTQSAATE